MILKNIIIKMKHIKYFSFRDQLSINTKLTRLISTSKLMVISIFKKTTFPRSQDDNIPELSLEKPKPPIIDLDKLGKILNQPRYKGLKDEVETEFDVANHWLGVRMRLQEFIKNI